jgi:hypothetical protein
MGLEAIEKLYPGSRPQLPARFSEVGLYDIPLKAEQTIKELSNPERAGAMTLAQAQAVIAAAQKKEKDDADAIQEGKKKAATQTPAAPKVEKPVVSQPKKQTKFAETVKIEYPPEDTQQAS